MIPYVFASVADDIICYSSDYCHWDCDFPDSVKLLEERGDVGEAIKPNLFSRNAARLYGLEVPSDA